MAVKLTVCNRALQILGARRISSLSEQSPSARACNLVYDVVRQSELRKHPWNFSITRVEIAASATAPAFGKAYFYPLPSDWLAMASGDPVNFSPALGLTTASSSFNSVYSDWVVEGRNIATDDAGPLQVRYVADVTDTTKWDPIFGEVMSAAMAYEMAEELTQSNTKKQDAAAAYVKKMNEAKSANAFDNVPQDPPPDLYITVRA